VTGTSSSARFLDSNVLVYAVVKPKKNVDERLAKIKESAREILRRIDRGEGGDDCSPRF